MELNEAKVHVGEMCMLREMLRVTKNDTIKNEYIKGNSQANPMKEKITKCCLKWYGDIHKRLETTL